VISHTSELDLLRLLSDFGEALGIGLFVGLQRGA